jgi:uncharacterized membrane protein YjjP (DUF1212 family)
MVSSPDNPASSTTSAVQKPIHQFLILSGCLLHRHGTPSNRIEKVLTGLSDALGVDGAFLYTPTSLTFSLIDETGESTYVRRIDSGIVDVDKLIRFDDVMDDVRDGKLSISDGMKMLNEIEASPMLYPTWVTMLAGGVVCGAVAVFFRGTPMEVLAATIIGLIIAILETFCAKRNFEPGLLGPMAGFAAAVGSLAFAKWIAPVDDRLVILAGLIVLLPGLSITVALTELAVGHLSAGVARLAGACTTLLTLVVGVAFGTKLAASWRNAPEPATIHGSEGWLWLALAIAPITFAIFFRARWPQWLVITVVTVAGFIASREMGQAFGIEAGAFCGALAVGACSNLYARIRDRPALVALTPGIIILVPGSVGFRSLTSFLNQETVAGIDFAFTMMIVAVALVGGILTANIVVPPKRIL